MTSRAFLRASLCASGFTLSLAAGSAWAQGVDPEASTDAMSVITVTGSRTITDNAQSPTPLTTVDIAELARTTPSDTADALNKLPTIMGRAFAFQRNVDRRQEVKRTKMRSERVFIARSIGCSRDYSLPEQPGRKILEIAAPRLPFVIGAWRFPVHVLNTRLSQRGM